jgi:VanZ family protein
VKRNVRRMLLVLWILIIFVLMGFPMLEVPKVKDLPVDKLYHFVVFFIMGLLAVRSVSWKGYFLIGAVVVLLAEFQQLFIPGRDFEVLDIAAGVIAVVVSYFVFRERRTNADVSKA